MRYSLCLAYTLLNVGETDQESKLCWFSVLVLVNLILLLAGYTTPDCSFGIAYVVSIYLPSALGRQQLSL